MKKFSTALLLLFAASGFCQSWQEMMLDKKNYNFYQIQSAFNEYWKDKDNTIKGRGYKPFKRWEAYVEPRVYPSGDLSLLNSTYRNFQEFVQNSPTMRMTASTTWSAIGPMGNPTGNANGQPRKAGRDNFITFHPTTAGTFWCGTPAGGLWKSTNNGGSWTTTTDYLTVTGCSDLAIDLTNTNNMFLATGDGEAGNTSSIGVLKSTDGGLTWNPTGLTFPVSQQREMRRLIIHPTNPLILMAATNGGIYRTTDGGNNWTQINTANMYDLEFNAANPSIVYAAGTAFYISTNGGASFTQVNTGITTNSQRMNIAVTPADPNYVYVIASSNATNGLLAIYRSVNGGNSFSTVTTAPDVLANACNSSATSGGQGWYDLAFAASPLNANEIVTGGVNVWRSTNGGSSWSIIGCWVGTGNPPYVHADHHELEYATNGDLYSCNDGGLALWTGTSWTDLNATRNIAQIYKVGLSALSPSLLITGHQDNGTNIWNGSSYFAGLAGDGMDCFIDRTNNNVMFASQYNGQFYKTTNGGSNWSGITSGLSGTAPWVSPWKQDPVNAQRIYAGYTQMFVSNNQGGSWTQLNPMSGSGSIVEFAIAPSDNQVMYVIRGTTVRKTADGGTTWLSAQSGIPTQNASPSFVAIDPTNANIAWVTCSGYSAGNKVFMTTNGGVSWTNISYNLPNIPANCVVHQAGTNGMIYVGMDVGVYYKDNSSSVWTLYNTGLPNTPVRDLEISPAAPNLLRAATYGRGVWQVDVIQTAAAPVTNFSFTPLGTMCPGVSVIMNDQSSNSPTNWNWVVTPTAQINSSSVQSPTITFPAGGVYSITFTSGNSFGTGSAVTKTISVQSAPSLTFTTVSSNTVCTGEDVYLTVDGGSSYTWTTDGSNLNTYSLIATNPVTLSVKAVGANGCRSQDSIAIMAVDCTSLPFFSKGHGQFSVFPNPAGQKILISGVSATQTSLDVDIYDVAGREIRHQVFTLRKDANEIVLNISDLDKGVYFVRMKPEDGEAQVTRLVKE